jgi:GT2 family glycosyltransferase
LLEVLVAKGCQPSRQRNLAAARARGEFLMFLDSDSLPENGCLARLLECFSDPKAAVAGGPNLPPREQTFFQSAVSNVLASWFGSMSVRARYAALGRKRTTTEKELILCNLMVRKDVYLKEGGLREDLYPNEENEFLNRLQAGGYRLYYQPAARVLRPRRADLKDYLRQSFRYGRGRMSQIFASFQASDMIHGLPMLFCFYLLALPLAAARFHLFALPLAAYLGIDLAACAVLLFQGSRLSQAAVCLALYPLRHIFYGFGMAWGIFSRPQAKPGKILIRRATVGAAGRPPLGG